MYCKKFYYGKEDVQRDISEKVYKILVDDPQCLTHINTIIIENDFQNIEEKNYVDTTLKIYGFKNVYREAGGWGPCRDMFYEVFKKIVL